MSDPNNYYSEPSAPPQINSTLGEFGEFESNTINNNNNENEDYELPPNSSLINLNNNNTKINEDVNENLNSSNEFMGIQLGILNQDPRISKVNTQPLQQSIIEENNTNININEPIENSVIKTQQPQQNGNSSKKLIQSQLEANKQRMKVLKQQIELNNIILKQSKLKKNKKFQEKEPKIQNKIFLEQERMLQKQKQLNQNDQNINKLQQQKLQQQIEKIKKQIEFLKTNKTQPQQYQPTQINTTPPSLNASSVDEQFKIRKKIKPQPMTQLEYIKKQYENKLALEYQLEVLEKKSRNNLDKILEEHYKSNSGGLNYLPQQTHEINPTTSSTVEYENVIPSGTSSGNIIYPSLKLEEDEEEKKKKNL